MGRKNNLESKPGNIPRNNSGNDEKQFPLFDISSIPVDENYGRNPDGSFMHERRQGDKGSVDASRPVVVQGVAIVRIPINPDDAGKVAAAGHDD